jgi:hypothetical protein
MIPGDLNLSMGRIGGAMHAITVETEVAVTRIMRLGAPSLLEKDKYTCRSWKSRMIPHCAAYSSSDYSYGSLIEL